MKLKLDDQGHVVLTDGKPTYIHDDGREIAFDGAQAFGKIGQLTGENTAYKRRFEEAETKLKSFEGITDPAAAIKALNTVKNLDDKKLVDAGEVEKVKNQAIQSVRAEFEPIVKERDSLKTALFDEKIGGAFARSKFIGEKVAIPADFVQASFGKNFSIEDGKIVAKDANGNQLFSPTRHGEPANFDEALSILIDAHPQRDSILKGSGASGGGAQGGGGGGGGKKTITRAQFAAMSPADQAAAGRDANTVITD